MRFIEKPISGVFEILTEPHRDERGSFERWYCTREFQAHGIEMTNSQGAVSRNFKRGTLRGLHYIDEAIGEAKLVRCIRGAVFDVVVDLRPGSPTFGDHVSVELDAEKLNALFVPRGLAHGYMTLTDDCNFSYQFSEPHRPGLEKGVRWDDPSFSISWPMPPTAISEKDKNWPYLNDQANT